MTNIETTVIKKLLTVLSPQGDRGRLTTLMFHKVPRDVDPLIGGGELCLKEFETIVGFLQEYSNLLPLGDAVDALRKGKLPARAVSITFDDGYAEWEDGIVPLLKERDIPATFFITTQLMSGTPLWNERIVAAVKALPDSGARLPHGFANHIDLQKQSSRIQLVRELLEKLKYVPLEERLAAIQSIESQATSTLSYHRKFDASTVRDLHSQGFEIGGHTIHHPILNECSEDEAMREIAGSREELSCIIGGRVDLFAYPNGRPGKDFSSKHINMVKQSGYKAALTSSGGAASRDSDIYQLPRSTMWETSQRRMAYRTAHNLLASEIRLETGKTTMSLSSTDVRCLLIASTFPPIHGGSAVVYENLCLHMPPGSIRVLATQNNYLTHAPVPGWKEHDTAVNFPVDRLPYLRPLMLPPPANILISLYRLIFQDLYLYSRVLLAAARIVRKNNINVVCVGELVTGSWLGIVLKKLFRCKLIIYVHGEEVTTETGGRLHGNLRRYYLHAADKVISVSSFTSDALIRQMGMRAEAIALVPNGVDTDRFKPGSPDREFLARQGLEGKRIIVTVGRLVPRKGMDMSIRAMAEIVRHIPNAHLLIVGDGDYRKELEGLIRDEAVGNVVTIVGKVSDNDLLHYLQICDLFVMPNRTMPDGDTEGFGLVFREANACGKAVVGGRAGGVVEAVIEGHTGMLVDGNKPNEIAKAVVTILADDEIRREMGLNGLKIAIENNTESMAYRFLRVCEGVL